MSLVSLDQLKIILNGIKQKIRDGRGDWAQDDPTADDYIKNKPQEVTSEDIVEWLDEENVITPLAASSGEIYTTNNNEILVL